MYMLPATGGIAMIPFAVLAVGAMVGYIARKLRQR